MAPLWSRWGHDAAWLEQWLRRLTPVSDQIEPFDEDPPLVASGDSPSPVPFEDLVAPEPIEAAPPTVARLLAFGAILAGGALGAMVGFGVGDVMFRDPTWAAVGAVAGALTGAVGVGVVANLTLRAMGEWKAVEHPEDEGRRGGRRRERHWSRRES